MARRLPHRPPLLNYSLGNAIIRHKGLSFASALWKPGDINCRGSLPVLRARVTYTAGARFSLPLRPPQSRTGRTANPFAAADRAREGRRERGHGRRLFRVLRIPLSCRSTVLSGSRWYHPPLFFSCYPCLFLYATASRTAPSSPGAFSRVTNTNSKTPHGRPERISLEAAGARRRRRYPTTSEDRHPSETALPSRPPANSERSACEKKMTRLSERLSPLWNKKEKQSTAG